VTEIDAVLARMQMPHHSGYDALADMLERRAKALRQRGPRTEDLVHLLAARGWAAGTLGDGGARSTEGSSSVERAADPDRPNRWHTRDHEWHEQLAQIEKLLGQNESLDTDVNAHAGDEDPLPVNTGACTACDRFCRPTAERPENRLKKGSLCPACYRAWLRAEQPQLSDWRRIRRSSLMDDQGHLHPEMDDLEVAS
jgi:hypothetical protein